MPLAESRPKAMKKGCWLGCAAGCPGENAIQSPVCLVCWATATPSKLEFIKQKYNLYADQPLCRMYGCWQFVRVKNKAEGICNHQRSEGECHMCSNCTRPSENKNPEKKPEQIQTQHEFAKTLREWEYPCVGCVRTVEREMSKGKPLVILKERRMKSSSSSQIELEEVAMRYRLCGNCASWCRNKKRWCEGCRSMVYCSRSCQKQDWKRHKEGCITMQNAEEIAWEERKLDVLEFLRMGNVNEKTWQ